MVKHNNMLMNPHFRKKWDRKTIMTRVITWFDQPAKKLARRQVRAAKAKAIAPRPVSGALRPIVRGQTQRYNTKVRAGRGFTLDELRKAGITPQEARTIGIAVDYRRKNRSVEGLNTNVQRLKLYQSKLVLFPRNAAKPKKGDASVEEQKAAVQQTQPLPIVVSLPRDKARAITDKEKTDSAYLTLRKAVAAANKVGLHIRNARLEEAGLAGKKKGRRGKK